MNNFAGYKTPGQLKASGDKRSLRELTALANEADAECMNCDEKVWKYGGCDLCFTCTTGEADASEDYEIIPAGGVQ